MQELKNKDEIREAALKVFSEKGYREARITDIASEAGVSTAMIYKYYKGKKELFDSLERPDLKELRPGFEGKRADIINCALICFGEHGFEGTSMDLVAKNVGLSKAMLYQYFKNKEEMFSAVMHETSFKDEMKSSFINKKSGNLQAEIYKIGISYMKMLGKPERIAFTRMVIQESSKYPEIGRIYHKQGFGYIAEIVEECLKKYQDEDCFKPDIDLYLASKTYVGSILAYAIQYKIVVGNQPIYADEDLVRTTTDIFLAGILK